MTNTYTPPAAEPTCYRHPDRVTYLSCGRCGKPLCPDCSEHGPVGIRCQECLRPVGRMSPQAALAAPEHVGRALLIGMALTALGAAAMVLLALLQLPSTRTLTRLVGGGDFASRFDAHALTTMLLNTGALLPAPNLLVAMVLGGLVGWAIWRAVGRSSNRRTAWAACLLGLAMPLLAAPVIAMVVALVYETPVLFTNLLFWVRALAAAGLSGLFAWLLGTQRHWGSRDLFD